MGACNATIIVQLLQFRMKREICIPRDFLILNLFAYVFGCCKHVANSSSFLFVFFYFSIKFEVVHWCCCRIRKCVVLCTLPTIPICRMESGSLACTKLRPWNNVYTASCAHFFVVSCYLIHLFGHASCSLWPLFVLSLFPFCHHRRLVKCMGQAHTCRRAGDPFN